MKERSGKDSKVEFQSGATKKSAPVATPRPRPKSVGKTYTNPPVNKMSDQQIRAGNYTLRTINPNALPNNYTNLKGGSSVICSHRSYSKSSRHLV